MCHGQVVHVETGRDWVEEWLLATAGSLERLSAHPVAAAVVGCAAARGVSIDLPVTTFNDVQGWLP